MPDSVKVKMFLLSEENGLNWAPAQFQKIIKTWVRCLHDNHCVMTVLVADWKRTMQQDVLHQQQQRKQRVLTQPEATVAGA